jgi:hypothetical protein
LDANTGGSTHNKSRKSKPLLFTLSETGDSYLYNYCSHQTCTEPNRHKAIRRCQKYSNGTRCFTFAFKEKILWKSDQSPKGLSLRKELKHGRNHVAQLIKDAGYYNGDITLLRGFKLSDNSESIINTTTSTPKITKKVVKKYKIKSERSIALSWDGYEDLIAGAVKFNEANYKGTLNIPLPNNDGTCDGTYLLQEGGKGTWQIACTNDMGAAGTLKWTENGGVTGKGRDHNDKKVKFTVSKKS